MKPAPGPYRCTPVSPPGLPPVDVEVTDGGMWTPGPFGGRLWWTWDPVGGLFVLGGLGLECLGGGQYRGVGPAGDVSGTCEPLPPPMPPFGFAID